MTMNWEAIGAVLLYLAVQIRSSRRSDQIVAAAQAASAVDEWIGQIVRDEDLFKLYRQGMSDYESLSRIPSIYRGYLVSCPIGRNRTGLLGQHENINWAYR
jgi:hypothetical protein